MICAAAIIIVGPLACRCQESAIAPDKRQSPEQIGRFKWGNQPIPILGSAEEFVQAYDQVMTDYIREVGAPGGALSVYFKGKLVYSKGFGWADIDKKIPFTPKTQHRISSLSKFLTKDLIEELIEYGELEPDTKAIEILKRGGVTPLVSAGQKIDSRLADVTIQQLLDHKSGITAGTDISECMNNDVIEKMKFAKPIRQGDALGYILGLPLEHDPGKEYVYSNFGYALLGKIVEIVSGKPYEEAIKEKVLAKRIDPGHWFVTTANRKDRREGEATYYSTRSQPTWDAYRLDVCAGAAGWVAPTEEIANFFQQRFSGPGWHYTLFGSYTGAVTVMRVHDNSLVYAANVNYRRGSGPDDNDVLFERLEKATSGLKLP